MEPSTLLLVGAIGLALILGIFFLVGYSEQKQRQARYALHAAKYGPELAKRIMGRNMWVDQTAEQLLDSLGPPADIDQKVLKTKVKEIWKYNPAGRNRFGLRITVENGVVIGWDQKD